MAKNKYLDFTALDNPFKGSGFLSSTFFQPDEEFVKSIIEYADDRLILDVGCGNGHFIEQIVKAGYNGIMGIDAYSDVREAQMRIMQTTGEFKQIMPWDVNDNQAKMLFEMHNTRPIIVTLCRPCHSVELIDGTINKCKEYNVPLLYIGLDRNIDMDLEGITYTILDLKGTSKENEKVYLIDTQAEKVVKQELHSDITAGPRKKYGLISPEGLFYECRYCGHNNLIYDLYKAGILPDSNMDADGWLKLTGAEFTTCEFQFSFDKSKYNYKTKEREVSETYKLTDAQVKAIKDYIKSLGRKFFNFNFDWMKISTVNRLKKMDHKNHIDFKQHVDVGDERAELNKYD